jgi:hypothetical protein
MKIRSQLFVLAVASIALAATSCKKDIVERDNTYPGSIGSTGLLNTMLAQNGPQTQSFTFNVANGMNFVGTSGTKVYIPANAFLYASQQPVTGTVTVTMVEVYNKRDMICSGGFTTSNGLPIVSAGEVEMRAWQGNNVLEYNAAAGPMAILFPVNNPDPQMEAFVAEDIREGVDFTQVDSALWVTTDTTWTPYPTPWYYAIYTVQMGWTNCDYFYSYAGDKTNVTVSVPSMCDNQNSMAFLVFPNLNIASQMWHYYSTPGIFDLGAGYEIPVGSHVRFIVTSEINGQLYWGEQEVTSVNDGHSLSVIPMPVTQAEFDQKLDGLN